MTEGEWFQKAYKLHSLYQELYGEDEFGFISCDWSSVHLTPQGMFRLFGFEVLYKYHDIAYPVRAYRFVNDLEFFAIMDEDTAKLIFNHEV